jgi:hypothetical protein
MSLRKTSTVQLHNRGNSPGVYMTNFCMETERSHCNDVERIEKEKKDGVETHLAVASVRRCCYVGESRKGEVENGKRALRKGRQTNSSERSSVAMPGCPEAPGPRLVVFLRHCFAISKLVRLT